MDTLVVSWRELLIAAIVVLAVYAAEMLLLLKFGRGQGWRPWRRTAASPAEHFAVGPLREQIAGLERQVAELRAELEATRKSLQPRETATPYAQAIQLARKGGQAGDVAAACGISRGEAELIVALYRKRETS